MKNRLLYFSVLSVLILSSGALVAQNNLLVNPGFEEGTQNDAPPWAVGGWRGSVRATTEQAHSGRRSIMIEGGGDEGGINSVMQIVPIDPTGATMYTLSAWVKLTAPVSADKPGRTRVRWYFDQGDNGAANYPEIATTDWIQYDSVGTTIIPPAGATMLAYRQYFYATHPGAEAAFIDDMEVVPSPSGETTYPGVRGTVKDKDGIPVAGAVVFLKNAPTAQEFAGSYAVTDSAGNYAVCTADDGDYYVVAWKQGYSLSEEKLFSIAKGAALASFNPVLTNRNGGRNLAISTAGRSTKAVDIDVGRYDDPQFSPVENLFDGNTISTRYWNNVTVAPANDRWAYVDLDPVGHATFTIDEFVLRGPGVTLMTEGADVALPTDFAIEYTTNDPATENEAGWSSHVAYSVSGASQVRAPVVIRLAAPITARAVRLHVTAGPFGLVDFQVNSDKLPRGTIQGVVKDATTGAPIAGARVSLFFPNKIQSDPDIYGGGAGNPVPFVIQAEETIGTPYEYAQGKNTEQVAVTDAAGRYELSANPGLPVKVTASVTGYPYATASITPPDDGSAAHYDFSLGKEYTVSGVVKDSNGPLYNAIVQIGGASSKSAVVTGADGKYSLVVGAGSQEFYADAYGHAGQVETINVSANLAKDITLTTQAEPTSLSADFETLGDWEIGQFDTNWVSVGTLGAALDGTQNITPGGKSSALVEEVKAVDNTGAEFDKPIYQMLQRTSGKRIAVESGKTYNVYFKAKSENWVTRDAHSGGPGPGDPVHHEVLWLDANGGVLDRVYSHPHWFYPQTFWQQYSLGHPASSDGSVALVRLAPPAGAAFLDLKIGWIRHPSGTVDDTHPDGINPPGSKLFVDDLVVDSFGAAGGAAPTISATKDPGGIKITWTGTLESADAVTGTWAAVPGATSPLTVKTDPTQRFYRSRSQ